MFKPNLKRNNENERMAIQPPRVIKTRIYPDLDKMGTPTSRQLAAAQLVATETLIALQIGVISSGDVGKEFLDPEGDTIRDLIIQFAEKLKYEIHERKDGKKVNHHGQELKADGSVKLDGDGVQVDGGKKDKDDKF